MKKVILAVLVIAFGLFFALPNLSWAQEDVYKAKCAACHGADGKGSPAGLKMGALAFSSPAVQKLSDARAGRLYREWRPAEESHARFRQ